MTSRSMPAVRIELADRSLDRARATLADVIAARWAVFGALVTRWSARRRLGRSIAHLDDRLLADIGLKPTDHSFGESLIRRFAAGGEVWNAADMQAPRNISRRDQQC
jgi:uncharacterized protein YjiS (DUF1127 family)